MAVEIIGATEATRVSRARVYDRNRGFGYREVWEGTPGVVEVKFNLAQLDPAIDTAEYESVDGVGRLVQIIHDDDGDGTGQTTEELNSFWEAIPMDLYKPIKSLPLFSEGLTDEQLSFLEKQRGRVERAEDFDSSTLSAVPETYVKLLRNGSDEYLRTQIVLQKTVPLGRRSIIQMSWIGVDRAHVLATADPGPNPPSELMGLLTGLPDYLAGQKQWLKRGPQLTQRAEGQYAIVYTWFFARRWSFAFYEGDNVDGNP